MIMFVMIIWKRDNVQRNEGFIKKIISYILSAGLLVAATSGFAGTFKSTIGLANGTGSSLIFVTQKTHCVHPWIAEMGGSYLPLSQEKAQKCRLPWNIPSAVIIIKW